MKTQDIESAARDLARANGESEASIQRIYWFPARDVIRLVEVDEDAIQSAEPTLRPFYFRPVDGVPFPSGIALIHPKEDRMKSLPSEWGVNWSDGQVVFERAQNGK